MAIALEDVTAVVVTRGDQELTELEASLHPFGAVAVWDNSVGDDLAVYGRYAALAEVETDVVYVQDDDVILPVESLESLAAAYEPGVLTANMPARFRHDFYRDHCLVGFGAIFDRDLPSEAFGRIFGEELLNPAPEDEWWNYRIKRNGLWLPIGDSDGWRRTCDVAFTALVSRKLVDVPYQDLPWADTPDRMWRQPNHVAERARMLELVRQVHDG